MSNEIDLAINRNFIDSLHALSYAELDEIGKFELARDMHSLGFLAGIDYALGRLDKKEQAE